MENIEKILNYSNGIMAYYNYLCSNTGAPLADPRQIEDINYIRYAKVSLIALFFTTKKEEMVEQESVDNFSSKIIDEALIKSIEMIATKNGDTYEIDSYKEKNPANIVAFLRNSFAHGRYHLDVENNKVIIDNKGIVFDLDIEKLYGFLCGSVCNLIKFPKTKKIVRIHGQNTHAQKLGINKITNRKEAELAVKSSILKKYTLFSLNGDDIPSEALDVFEGTLDAIKRLQADENTVTYLLQTFKKIANKNNLEIMISKEKVKGKDLEDVLDLLDRSVGFYEIESLEEQIKYMLYCLVEKKEPEYQKEGYLNGLVLNMAILNEMERNKEFDLQKILKDKHIDFYNVSIECFLSSLLSKFNTIYTYPLETSYTNDNEYRLDRSDEFDFSKLDLDFLKPSLINLNMSLLNGQDDKLIPNISKKEILKELIEKTKENLEKAKLKANSKGISFQQNKLDELQESLVETCKELTDDINTLEKIKEDYKVNQKYYYNRAIIEGLRNSIAHGHVRIKKFESGGDIDDMVINFQDIYKGELTFEISMTIKELEKLIDVNTIMPMLDYLIENKSDEITKENLLKRLIKKVMNFK